MLGLSLTGPARGDQLVDALRAAVRDGTLAPGTRLPSTRDLAADLRVSRGLVVTAYEQLTAEGWLSARRGAGTVVALAPTPTPAPFPVHHEPPLPVPLRPGVPDLALFPRAGWRRAYERALATVADRDLDYPDPAGSPRLRAALAEHLGRVRAARADPAHLLITTATAQALTLLATALAEASVPNGSRVAEPAGSAVAGPVLPHLRIGVEDPGSAGIREHLLANGLEPVPIPVDCSGITVPPAGLAAVLVTPAHQYPTGVVLSPARRAALVAWARDTGALIIEDDYDAEFRYDRDPVGCVQGVAPDVTALVGSVSKALAPAVRLGWLLVPPALCAAVTRAKTAADRGGPTLEQLALAELLTGGGYDRHLRRARRAYRTRRDALLAAVTRHLPDAQVEGIAAGLHAVVTLPEGVDDVALCARAVEHGLAPTPLSSLRLAAAGPPGLVIGYAATSPAELTAGIRLLASLRE
ncbi:GntR family transcriptional regulator [Longispora fulva]|uniref:GntR family transcriptional regulator/MocR family aminotransferase n=1 Tax=Longispora fulva TaxID=619741 RepID=A0A8J7KXB0_9ACTN|nr:PLP-dependent aminotransferase family protein [Longispora fulva]MBG6137597.1 GntR family transcriptional regulator/MocR family aminotransferase [Longispora fulva]GIG61047.1 GntR family transcriptional regulator [Longispora fulva]